MKKILTKKRLIVESVAVVSIVAAGAYVRFVGLTCLPPGLYPDEAMNISDGLTVAEAGEWKLFFENNNGREGLYINILGYLLHWFGPNLWVVRFLPALIGTLTLPAIYWLGRRMSGRFGGIMALGLTAFSYWHLNFSRIGFRALLMVFMLSWAFAFLTEGLFRLVNLKKRLWLFFAISGILFGLSLHTYIAVRIAPAAVVALFLLAIIFFTALWKDILKGALITLFFTALTAAPLVYDFVLNPVHFTGRTSNVSVLNSPNLAQDLGKSVFLTLASFVAYGDQNWRHNYPGLPIVLPIWGVILFIGVGWGISRFFKEIGKKLVRKGTKDKKKNWETVMWIFLIAWWGFLLLPSIMTNEGLPHALRSIGAIPPTFLLTAMIVNKWAKNLKLKAIFAGLMILSAVVSVYAYFFLWGESPDAYGAFDNRTSGIGIYLRDEIAQRPDFNYYLVTNQDSFRTDADLPVMIEPIRFYTWQSKDKLKYILPDEFQASAIKKPAKIFFLQNNESILEKIYAAFPNANLVKTRLGSNQSKETEASPQRSVLFAPTDQECFLNTTVPVSNYFNYIDVR
jgi:4-amino-4-deoxy-L-arabinose transferase-like glycosyltransferase